MIANRPVDRPVLVEYVLIEETQFGPTFCFIGCLDKVFILKGFFAPHVVLN